MYLVLTPLQSYIMKHAETLHLGLYKTDPTVKETVNEFLSNQYNNIKSGFRKSVSIYHLPVPALLIQLQVWTSVTKKTGLMTFARKTIEGYHLPVIPDTPPQQILATFALMVSTFTSSVHAVVNDMF